MFFFVTHVEVLRWIRFNRSAIPNSRADELVPRRSQPDGPNHITTFRLKLDKLNEVAIGIYLDQPSVPVSPHINTSDLDVASLTMPPLFFYGDMIKASIDF